jgi:hypothetical protein
VEGDPRLVVACSCENCQLRTGSVFSVSSYFGEEQIAEISGESDTFELVTEAGRSSQRHFCPNCGATVYWYAELFPQSIGIAVGAFADRDFPEPSASVWSRTKHHWVEFPEHWLNSDTQNLDT